MYKQLLHYFFLSVISTASIHFFGTPKLPSSSSTTCICFPWTITSCPPPATCDTLNMRYQEVTFI